MSEAKMYLLQSWVCRIFDSDLDTKVFYLLGPELGCLVRKPRVVVKGNEVGHGHGNPKLNLQPST